MKTEKANKVCEILGSDGIITFKKIFEACRKERLPIFFNQEITKALFEVIEHNSKLMDFFKDGVYQSKYTDTYRQITYDLEMDYNLSVPKVWR